MLSDKYDYNAFILFVGEGFRLKICNGVCDGERGE
jgi:hypothetical protein